MTALLPPEVWLIVINDPRFAHRRLQINPDNLIHICSLWMNPMEFIC